jgi:hypothetical protein
VIAAGLSTGNGHPNLFNRRLRDMIAQGSKAHKNILIAIAIVYILLLLIDRYFWAQLAPWREDEATNLWLGYTQGLGHIPVGLISTSFIPNPNGMLILGSFLSGLPSLLSISFFLGCLQIALLVLISWRFFRTNWHYMLLTAVPSLTSVILRSSSVEFANHYILASVNVFFLFWALRYLERQSLWNLPPIAALVLLAPALYLAGVVNSIAMFVITFGLILYKRPGTKDLWLVTILIVLMILVSGLLTWLPYFQQVSPNQVSNYHEEIPAVVLSSQPVWKSFLEIPIYVPFQWANAEMFPYAIKHAGEHIISGRTRFVLGLVGNTFLLQTVFAVAALFLASIRAWRRFKGTGKTGLAKNLPALELIILSALMIGLSYSITLVLGGPDWIHGKRPDQTVAFLPMFLFVIFLLPVTLVTEERAQKIIVSLSLASLTIFAVLNLACGFMIVRDHLQYAGRRLSQADVPLIDKQRVVNFIVQDWRSHSNADKIPVDYDLGGEIWDWVPEFGKGLEKWYPAPMTTGRSFDYELLHSYGLTNAQEGIQLRTFGTGRYLVTYTFHKPPKVDIGHITHHLFGRLRVSVVEK